jgi:Ran GTPase-activating protein (RanGAP) involved in mRNA processing and transport
MNYLNDGRAFSRDKVIAAYEKIEKKYEELDKEGLESDMEEGEDEDEDCYYSEMEEDGKDNEKV